MYSVKCPNCGRVNTVSATNCLCGYDLVGGVWLAPNPIAVAQPGMNRQVAAASLPIDFRGRAGRLEFLLINIALVAVLVAIAIVGAVVDEVLGNESALCLSVMPCLLVPLAIISTISGVRRLHDLGQSGWLLLVGLIPVVGFILQLYLFLAPGKQQPLVAPRQ